MRVAIGSDHAGYELKEILAEVLRTGGYEVLDLGTNSPQSVDYPDFGRAVGEAVASGKAERGVAVCGTGIGIGIAVNRVPGVRCGVVHDVTTARLTREHNDANAIAIGARIIGTEVAKDCLHAFLTTDFGGARHKVRVAKLG